MAIGVYAVEVVDRNTGKAREVEAQAANPEAARVIVAALGEITGPARLVRVVQDGVPPTAAGPMPDPHEHTRQPVVIEQTAKLFKRWMLIFGLVMLAGFAACTIGVVSIPITGGFGGAFMLIGQLGFATGFIGWIVVRILAWWHHG